MFTIDLVVFAADAMCKNKSVVPLTILAFAILLFLFAIYLML